jgi:hypothetical protein
MTAKPRVNWSALAILTELKMPREIIAVDNNLDEAKSNGPGNWLPVSTIVAVILRKGSVNQSAFEVFSCSNVKAASLCCNGHGWTGMANDTPARECHTVARFVWGSFIV